VTPNAENAMVVWRWLIVPKFACGKIVVAVGGRAVAPPPLYRGSHSI